MIKMQGICMQFGGVTVLNDVDFDVAEGEVHALVGENGAGKSTLVKILVGIYQPTGGRISIDGKETVVRSPRDAAHLGILQVYQELSVLPNRTVAQNIAMSQEPTRFGLVRAREVDESAKAILGKLQLDIPVNAYVGNLGSGVRQFVEIARCVSRSARLIIMDEPTTRLSMSESQRLFDIIKQLRTNGISVVYISHRIDDIYELAERVTVLRDGLLVATSPIGSLPKSKLVEQIIGEQAQETEIPADTPDMDFESQEPFLEVRNLSAHRVFSGVNLTLSKKEILGVYGLLGAGQREVGRSFVGLTEYVTGEILLAGKPIDCSSPMSAKRAGISFLSDDRRGESVIGVLAMARNIVLSSHHLLSRQGLIDNQKANQVTREAIDRFGIRPPFPWFRADRMSGGNQQKMILARCLQANPKVLIVAEPTQGVDIKTKVEIHGLLRSLAQQGIPSLVISTDLNEISHMCDRVAVMRRGQVVGILNMHTQRQSEVLRLSLEG